LHGVPSARTVLTHVPLVQASAVHGSPSLQSAPLVQPLQPARGAWTQPVEGLQESLVQVSASLQVSGVPVVHVPAWHVSPPLHWLPSLHEEPFALLLKTQPALALHESVVHGLPSVQVGGVPAAHVPAWQVSAPLHWLPSLQGAPFARCE
jgi:hypothetical protein